MRPLRTDSAAFVPGSPAESLVHCGTKENDIRHSLTKLSCPVRVSPCVHSQGNITAIAAVSLAGEDMLAPVMVLANGSPRKVLTVLLTRFQREDWGCLAEAGGSGSRL